MARATSATPRGAGIDKRGRKVSVTYICPGRDGEDGGHTFRGRIAYGIDTDQVPEKALRCPKCRRTDGFEARADVIAS